MTACTSIISRTGYTGEDGFEVYAAPDKAERLWEKMLDAGRYGTPEGVTARRARRAQHPAARSRRWRSTATRSRRDDAARSQPRLDHQTEQGRLHRARGARAARRRRASRRRSSASRSPSAASRATARTCYVDGANGGPRHLRQPGALPEEEHRDGLRPCRARERGPANSDRRARPRRSARKSSQMPFYKRSRQ